MTAVTLTRIDHERRMASFYVLDVQPDLFGKWCFVREWGRIGPVRPDKQRPLPDRKRSARRARASAPREEARGYVQQFVESCH